MAQTVIRGTQILNNTVQRQDLDTSTVGQAVVTKIVQGSGITLSSTGADSGTGDVTVSSPDVVSTDAGNIATLGTDNHILVPQSQIWSVRLRSFQALGNNTFEVDARTVGAGIANPATGVFPIDRWANIRAGLATMTYNMGQAVPSPMPVAPGTSFALSSKSFLISLTAQQASLAAGDVALVMQAVEGPQLRELISDVHSVSIMAYTNVAGGLKFALSLRDPGQAHSYVHLCTLTTANVWQLITIPNIPVFSASGNFSLTPGTNGYILGICFASGTTYVTSANDAWVNMNAVGAIGMDNLGAKPIGSQLLLGFIQHEPGAQCSTPIDCPFGQNYDGDFGCLRYYCKSYDYGVKAPTANATAGIVSAMTGANALYALGTIPFPKTMAKAPTFGSLFTVYAVDGTANAVLQLGAGGNAGVSTILGLGTKGFYGVGFPSAVTVNQPCQMHYAADTGW